jgi:hypothetical protein
MLLIKKVGWPGEGLGGGLGSSPLLRASRPDRGGVVANMVSGSSLLVSYLEQNAAAMCPGVWLHPPLEAGVCPSSPRHSNGRCTTRLGGGAQAATTITQHNSGPVVTKISTKIISPPRRRLASPASVGASANRKKLGERKAGSNASLR